MTQTSQNIAQQVVVQTRPAAGEIQVIADDERMDFLPSQFGRHYLKFENTLFALAGKTLQGYKGGYWEFAITHGGTGFAFPKTGSQDELISMTTIFGHNERQVPALLAGLITSALTLSYMVSQPDRYHLSEEACDRMIDHYHGLMAAGHEIADNTGYGEEFFSLTD